MSNQTVSPHSEKNTDQSDQADSVSNTDFLLAVFANAGNKETPVLVSLPGNPSETKGYQWSGAPWDGEAVKFGAQANNYFTVAAFTADDAGNIRRRKSNFCSLHAVMLDDIGTKVEAEQLTLPPSWQIETSPGNFQAGYLLDQPITDPNLADNLMNAIIDAGLCDPGASGPQSRLARLPVASNGKHVPPFACRLTRWTPNDRYALADLVKGLKLDLSAKPSPSSKVVQMPGTQQKTASPRSPAPVQNPVVSALQALSLYKRNLGAGKHDITCPWVAEHTGAVDSGTAYMAPDQQYPIGGFSCLHGHCTHRTIRDLLSFVGVDFNAARMKPVITVEPGELARTVMMAESALASTGSHFHRHGEIVAVHRDGISGRMRALAKTRHTLAVDLSIAATWERFDQRLKAPARIDPPERCISALIETTQYNSLPRLVGIVRQPFLQLDGSLSAARGYDTTSGIWCDFDSAEFDIPDAPSRQDAERALNDLLSLLDEFEFESPHDRSAAVSALLTAAIRPTLPSAPMLHAHAAMPGSGKSYLCRIISAFATPNPPTPTSFPDDDTECSKQLLALLLTGPSVIEFDNVTRNLAPYKSLCTALSADHLSGRVLGASKTATVSTRALFLSSGNNVRPIKDMTRRCISIRLAPTTESPASRRFSHPHLIEDIMACRAECVSRALIIVRAWLCADQPSIACTPMAGYENWSNLCRQPLLWLGEPDPATEFFKALDDDPERDLLGRLLAQWELHFGSNGRMVREAVAHLKNKPKDAQDFADVLDEIAGERQGINNNRLGSWIRGRAGQIVDGKRFVKSPVKRNAESWRVESV